MPDLPNDGLLAQLGLNAKLLTAGFLGGVLRAFMLRSADPVTIIGSIVAGVFASNYLGATAGYYLRNFLAGDSLDAVGGFVVGMCAMAICQWISQGLARTVQRKFGIRDASKPL